MTILRIQAFLSIVETGSFSEAAIAMYTTQATVSKHIHSLEKELGYELFDRSHRKPALTHAGQIFHKYALDFVRLDRNLKQDLNMLCGSETPSISIVSIPVMAQYGLSSLINEFRKTYPHIRVTVSEMETSELLPGLECKKIPLAFCRLTQPEAVDFERIDMFSEITYAVLPEKHPLADRSCISIRELKDETYLLPNRQTGLYDFSVELCHKYGGFFPEVSYTGNRPDTLGDMVAQQMGISLFPELGAKYLLGQHRVVCIPLKEDVKSIVALVRPRGIAASPGSSLFWKFVRSQYSGS